MDVKEKLNSTNPVRYLVGLILMLLFFLAVKRELQASDTSFDSLVKQSIAEELSESVIHNFLPLVSFSQLSEHERNGFPEQQIAGVIPLYAYSRGLQEQEADAEAGQEDYLFVEELLTQEELNIKESESLQSEQQASLQTQQTASEPDDMMQGLLKAENEAAMNEMVEQEAFVPHELQNTVDLQALAGYENLVDMFYTIDANTMAGSDQLEVTKLSGRDLRISKGAEGPQILIYHTHSQEGFADSVPGDVNTTIVGVGAHLSEILQKRYGYQVLHHTGQYDVETRDDAYSSSLPAIEQVLSENPSIEVIIDLHRDSMPEETRLVMDLDGRPTARFMFFNGLSRTKNTGDIAYLYNENLENNLAFSFQMQLKAMEYYPGLTRKIYLKGYRYNMHLRPRTTLIELGAQNNTVEEAMNACEPLAHIIDMVLSGQ